MAAFCFYASACLSAFLFQETGAELPCCLEAGGFKAHASFPLLPSAGGVGPPAASHHTHAMPLSVPPCS